MIKVLLLCLVIIVSFLKLAHNSFEEKTYLHKLSLSVWNLVQSRTQSSKGHYNFAINRFTDVRNNPNTKSENVFILTDMIDTLKINEKKCNKKHASLHSKLRIKPIPPVSKLRDNLIESVEEMNGYLDAVTKLDRFIQLFNYAVTYDDIKDGMQNRADIYAETNIVAD